MIRTMVEKYGEEPPITIDDLLEKMNNDVDDELDFASIAAHFMVDNREMVKDALGEPNPKKEGEEDILEKLQKMMKESKEKQSKFEFQKAMKQEL